MTFKNMMGTLEHLSVHVMHMTSSSDT